MAPLLTDCPQTLDPRGFSPLNLAYMGDAVYELLVRRRLLAAGNRPTGELNRLATAQVRAAAQAGNYYKILEYLTENEMAILKRGRNANPKTRAKSATVADYRNATGLEALFGYLYLAGEFSRIEELFEICYKEN
ncbi:MAG: ribonuclease III [Defluviitaleaceae bacterium]|nr:ribonuclease III [Defluviitaleaceae bacterium]